MSLLFNTLSRFVNSFSSKEQASFNFMAAITIYSDFGAQENKICHCFHFFKTPSICREVRDENHSTSTSSALLVRAYTWITVILNRLKGLYLIDRVPEELWTEVCDIVQKVVIKTIPKKKKLKKAKWLSEEALQIPEKTREAKGKGEKERYTHLNAEFQRTARRDKAFFSDQCKEIEENNRMGKTRDLFKKIRDTNGIFHAKMGSVRDRNGMDLTEAEDIKKRWQENTEELYKKDLHGPDIHDCVITHLEPDILKCEVK